MRLRPSTGSMSPENPICRAAGKAVHEPAMCELHKPLQPAFERIADGQQPVPASSCTGHVKQQNQDVLALTAHGLTLLRSQLKRLANKGITSVKESWLDPVSTSSTAPPPLEPTLPASSSLLQA